MTVASKRPSSVWTLVLWAIGLVLVFVGERILPTTPPGRWTATGLGTLCVLVAVVLRWIRASRLDGDAKGIEKAFAIFSTLGLVAIAVYFVTADPVVDWTGLSHATPDSRKKWEALLTCTWIALVMLTALPMFFAQLALEPMRLAERVEWRRVRHAAANGATLAMACGYAALFIFSASGLPFRADFSRLRTGRASEATVKVASAIPDGVRVLAFFPPVSEVRAEVLGYLRDLAGRAGTLHVETIDRLESPQLAKDMNVAQDGTVVIVHGSEKESLTFSDKLEEARAHLKSIDADFYKALQGVLREPRTAYLTVGHGELNDTHVGAVEPGRTADGVRSLLERLGFTIRTLSVTDGLDRSVPADATFVIVLGPTEPFSSQEVDSLRRYLDKGGHALLALDPDGKQGPEGLAELGNTTLKTDLVCDDRNHAVRRMNETDNAIILTNRFSSHPAVATLSRLGSRALFFVNAGTLETKPGATTDAIVRTLPSTFIDKNRNFKLDEPGEVRGTYTLAVATSAPVANAAEAEPAKDKKKAKSPIEKRVVVLADADVLSDAALMNASMANGNPQFFADVAKWLGGEEAAIGGLPDTGEDVRIEHSKQKDTALFYSTIFGAPALVLGLGLVYTRRTRRTSRRS